MKPTRRHRLADVHRDGNEDPLVALAERLGGHVMMCGPLDFWLWQPRTGWLPIEVKRPKREGTKAELTPLQKRFISWCNLHGAPHHIWRSDSDVFKTMGAKVSA